MDAGLKDEDLIYWKAKAGNDLMVANRKSTGSILYRATVSMGHRQRI